MPDTVEDLLDQLNRTKEALNGSYCDGELKKCDDLNTEAWSLFARYMLALAERETFKNLRDSFAEKYAAAAPEKGASPLPEAITSLRDQIDTQLAGIDAQADNLNYDQATKDLNALFTGSLADLQKTVESYDKHYADYDKNRKSVGDDYDLYMANMSLYPESLNAVGKRIGDAHSAMTKAEESGDYETALNQQGLLATALEEAQTGLDSHNADLKAEFDKRSKDLDERWQKLLDASPQKSTGNTGSTDPEDDSKHLKSLETEIVNGFVAAAENAKQPPYDIAFEKLDKVENSLEAYDAELASLEQAATDEQDADDYRALKKELAPKVAAAAEPSYEALKEKNQLIHEHFRKAEEYEADGIFARTGDEANAYDELLKVQVALADYEKAEAALDDAMMEFTDKEDEWKKKLDKLASIFALFPDLATKRSLVEDEVLTSASSGDFTGADSVMEGYLAELHHEFMKYVEPFDLRAREAASNKEPGFDKQRKAITLHANSMMSEAKAKKYQAAFDITPDLDSIITQFEEMLESHASLLDEKTRKKTNEDILLSVTPRINATVAALRYVADNFDKFIKKRPGKFNTSEFMVDVATGVAAAIGVAFPPAGLYMVAFGAVAQMTKKNVASKFDPDKPAISQAAILTDHLRSIAAALVGTLTEKMGEKFMQKDALLWDKIAAATAANRAISEFILEAGVPHLDGSRGRKVYKEMVREFLKWEHDTASKQNPDVLGENIFAGGGPSTMKDVPDSSDPEVRKKIEEEANKIADETYPENSDE